MSALTGLIIHHELRLFKRNSMMWLRFVLFYAVFVAALVTDVLRDRGERATITAVGLMILAAVGVASAFAAESFVQDKERRTMEALLLIPTSARALATAKSVFVVLISLCGIGIAFLTGPVIAILVGQPHQYASFFSRPILVTALVICPPASFTVTALGTIVSSRSRSLQTAAAGVPVGAMAAILPAVVIAYWVSTGPVVLAIGLTVLWWGIGVAVWHWALSGVTAGQLTRTRGK